MAERDVGRSIEDIDPETDADGAVWQRLIDRLVEEGEPLESALCIADRILRRRRRVATAPTGVAPGGDEPPRGGS